MMKIDIYGEKKLFIEHGKAIEEVLQRAVKQALAEHKRAGNFIAAWENEEVVFIEPKDIVTEDPFLQGRI